MQDQGTGSYEPGVSTTPLGSDRVIGNTPGYGSTAGGRALIDSGTRVGEDTLDVKNRVQWGPIIAGLVSTIASMLVLTVLGLAVGASAFEPRTSGETIGTAAAIWGAASAIISFLIGGWVAAKTAAVGGPGSGMINGLMVGATALALILYLTGAGLGNLFGTVGSNIGDIANVAQDQAQAQGVTTQDAQNQAQQAQSQIQDTQSTVADTVRNSYDEVRDSAWGTLAGLVLALGASAVGGLLGHNKRRDLIEGTR